MTRRSRSRLRLRPLGGWTGRRFATGCARSAARRGRSSSCRRLPGGFAIGGIRVADRGAHSMDSRPAKYFDRARIVRPSSGSASHARVAPDAGDNVEPAALRRIVELGRARPEIMLARHPMRLDVPAVGPGWVRRQAGFALVVDPLDIELLIHRPRHDLQPRLAPDADLVANFTVAVPAALKLSSTLVRIRPAEFGPVVNPCAASHPATGENPPPSRPMSKTSNSEAAKPIGPAAPATRDIRRERDASPLSAAAPMPTFSKKVRGSAARHP